MRPSAARRSISMIAQQDRPGNAAAVAAAGRRGSELELEQLRRGIQLLVHELDLVDRAADAAGREGAAHQPAADGAQSAGGVRAPVRQRLDAGSPRRAHEAEPQHPRLAGQRSSRRLRRQLGPSDVRTVNQYTDEIREIERRIQLAAKHSGEVPELDLPPGIPEQFDEHVRLHSKMLARRLQGGHHPRRDVARRARPDRAACISSRRARCSPRAAPA